MRFRTREAVAVLKLPAGEELVGYPECGFDELCGVHFKVDGLA